MKIIQKIQRELKAIIAIKDLTIDYIAQDELDKYAKYEVKRKYDQFKCSLDILNVTTCYHTQNVTVTYKLEYWEEVEL